MTHLTGVEVAVALSSVEHPTWVKNAKLMTRIPEEKPSIYRDKPSCCRARLEERDSAGVLEFPEDRVSNPSMN
jgi:hypothetical protein